MAFNGDESKVSEDSNVAALRQVCIDNSRLLEECQRTILNLTADFQSLRREVGNLKHENRTLKQVNRLVWYLARKLTRSQYDRLCIQLETDEGFRNNLSALMQDSSLLNIKDITKEFLNQNPQFQGSEKCCILIILGACCCCCQSH